MTDNESRSQGSLRREMNMFDAAMLLFGSVVGTGIFLVTGDIALSAPAPGWILLGFAIAGLIAMTGGLAIGELGAMLPKAGGLYVYLKEAFGPAAGFLFGWAFFLILWNGGNAAVAVAFAEFLSFFFPFLSTQNMIFTLPLPGFEWQVSYGQVVAVMAVAGLTMLHYYGLKLGVFVQNILTGFKILAIAILVLLGFTIGNGGNLHMSGMFSTAQFEMHWLSAIGIALIACMWSYDGWYSLSYMGGEIKNVKRNLPLGNIFGILAVTIIYIAVNLVYFYALPMDEIAGTTRIGEAAAAALFGPAGAMLISALMVFSAFATLNAGIISGPRVTYAMADDKLFFRKLADIHPRYNTPGPSIILQGVVISILCLSGTYKDLYELVAFAWFIFFFLTGLSLFVLRWKQPDLPRPYRAWGYPVTPAIFVIVSGALFVNTIAHDPVKSILALVIILTGLPVYIFWKRKL